MNDETWSAVDAYFEQQLIPSDTTLEMSLQASEAAGLPSIQVSASQGKFLHLLALAQGALRILEVGTLGGFSTLWLVRALPADGHLVTLEVEPWHAEVARGNFARAGAAERIELKVGPALETLARLRAEHVAPFDFVFIDADKPNNLGYVQAALHLSRVGTLIVVDNVVREGAVVAQSHDAAAEGVRRMTEWIRHEPRLSATVIQTVGVKGYDGFLLARVQAGPRIDAE
jgi:predicted O-methyltransferase YrrM